ncbi:hypothetical protein TIFTF001_054467 [Ficus carica]|uniref:Uncharacterized protein n=1 Tax=Ficus carica TaxID=3494 RepID=A0AA88JHS6_FICCA|nr:hypothetical protein TIFTF001_054467 [Ficus carica]
MLSYFFLSTHLLGFTDRHDQKNILRTGVFSGPDNPIRTSEHYARRDRSGRSGLHGPVRTSEHKCSQIFRTGLTSPGLTGPGQANPENPAGKASKFARFFLDRSGPVPVRPVRKIRSRLASKFARCFSGPVRKIRSGTASKFPRCFSGPTGVFSGPDNPVRTSEHYARRDRSGRSGQHSTVRTSEHKCSQIFRTGLTGPGQAGPKNPVGKASKFARCFSGLVRTSEQFCLLFFRTGPGPAGPENPVRTSEQNCSLFFRTGPDRFRSGRSGPGSNFCSLSQTGLTGQARPAGPDRHDCSRSSRSGKPASNFCSLAWIGISGQS